MKLNPLVKAAVASVTLAGALVGTAAAANITLPTAGIFEDDNIEYIIGANGQIKTSGTLAVGDVLYAYIGFNSIQNSDNSTHTAFGLGQKQISGVSALQITSISSNLITFGAWDGFEAIYGAGALAALYASDAGEFSVSCNTAGVAACEAAATQSNTGSLWAVAGLANATDFWASSAAFGFNFDTVTIQTLAQTNGAVKVGTAAYGLSVLENHTGYNFGEQVCIFCADGSAQIVGSGDVLGGAGLGSPFFARSDFDFSFATTTRNVPEPTSLALVGGALLGLGAMRRRAAKAKA